MEKKLSKRAPWLLLATAAAMVLNGCASPVKKAQACAACEENGAVIAGAMATSPRPTCNWFLPVVEGVNNCHGFAWQIDTGIPTGLPGYGIDRMYVTNFWDGFGGNFTSISGSARQPGDKVMYGGVSHSAVVYSLTPDRYISYCMSYSKPRIHRPDDPAGIYAHLGENNFGEVSTFWRCTRSCLHGGGGGTPIEVFYSDINKQFNFAVERDGTEYTAYVVKNTAQANQYYFWNVTPLALVDGRWQYAGAIWRRNVSDAVVSEADMRYQWNQNPQATRLVITVQLTDPYFRGIRGYIQIKIDR